ncbi:MAG TPA: two-component regulator propeller domain-containing protein [Verrucomicrobiae bacterium]|nr:two-component regulator propeller domain-containing protein [Verrucomicrobiae bacterium]
MPIGRTFPFALVFCFALFAAAGVLAAASDSPFTVDSWTAENGLPDNEVFSVVQSKDGYLWIGTLHGLVRFDGNQFTWFDEMNTPGLNSDWIVFLYEDRQTNLWIGTQSSGLAVIQNGKIKGFEKETAGIGPVTAAIEDAGNDVYFYSESGLAQYHSGQMNYYPGVHSSQLEPLAQHLIVPSPDGGGWELWGGRIKKVDRNGTEKDFGPFPWKSPVQAASEDSAGNLVVGTFGGGIFWFDAAGNYRHVSNTNGLSSDLVLSLSFDSEGDLWAGTDGGGLDRVKRKIFASPENFYPWAVQSISEDAEDGFWAAVTSAGVSHWQTNITRVFKVGEGQALAWTVLVDGRHHVWAGSRSGSMNEGLFMFQTNHFSPMSAAGILGRDIFALFESQDGRIWAGSGNGLGCWNGQQWKLYTTADGLSGNAVSAIAEDSAGHLWVGTEGSGLNYFDGGRFVSYRTTNGLPGDDISCLYVDSDGVLWVGTGAHGLARFKDKNWKCFSTRDGLPSNSLGYIIGDDDGFLWIGSNAGLMRIQRAAFDGTNSLFCRVYGRADGLPNRECSSGSQPAAIRSRDGELWFSTIEGPVWVDPSKLKANHRPPRVFIESVRVDTREQITNGLNSASSSSITIPPGKEQLDISYTALNFSSPQAVRFRYRLEGHETRWTGAGNLRAAHYADLLPGNYQFHVIACNEDGVWNTNGAVLDIVALPQFWQTDTFRIVVILLFLGAVVGTVRYVSTQKLHRQVQVLKQREALEHERARIARDLHDQLGANLTQVALLGEMAEADKNLPEEVEEHSRQISQTARDTTRSLDEIVWAVNPSNDTLEGLANYVCKYAQEYLALANLPSRVDVPAQLPAAAIPPEVRHNVYLAFKEAVHNVIKHAHAREVWVRLILHPKHLVLQVEDNGRGMDKQTVSNRNGLRNMKRRMDDIGGDFSISPGANGGTLVQLTVPLRDVEKLNR